MCTCMCTFRLVLEMPSNLYSNKQESLTWFKVIMLPLTQMFTFTACIQNGLYN